MQETIVATNGRLAEINREFEAGFKFLESYPKSVTFFGAHQTKEGDPMYEDARGLAGKIVEELGYAVLTGGSSGIMEAANRGAFEAGGQSLGLHINLPTEQVSNPYITAGIDFRYFFVRKVCLSFAAESYIFYPGGYGTLDEFFEILTLIQTKKIEQVPVICVGTGYWSKLKDFITSEVLGKNNIQPEDMNLFTITDNHDEVLEIIKKSPIRTNVPYKAEVLNT